MDRTLDQCKLRFALWSAQAVRALIKQLFAVDLPVRTVRKHLSRWGSAPQRPLKRAYEQRPEEVDQWLKEEYPAIAERAKQYAIHIKIDRPGFAVPGQATGILATGASGYGHSTGGCKASLRQSNESLSPPPLPRQLAFGGATQTVPMILL